MIDANEAAFSLLPVEFGGFRTRSVDLMDGRTIIVPLAWYPRLLGATRQQRDRWETSGRSYGIHWPEIDEDLGAEGLLRACLPKSQFAKGKS